MKKVMPIVPVNGAGDDVGAALSLLRDTIKEEDQRICKEGGQALQSGNLETAKEALDFATRLRAFNDRVAVLQKEWNGLEDFRDNATPAVQKIVSKRFFGRKPKGQVTPQSAFERPILEALVEMGGGGKTEKVLDRIGMKMNGILKPIDYERHKSNQIRWRNTAQWARDDMANQDGRMKHDSHHGYWEISDKGRSWLNAAGSSAAAPAPVSNQVKDLDRNQPHTLDEDMTFKRPCGLTLDGKRYSDVATWSRVYALVLLQLAKKDPARFKALPDNPATITKRGKRHFSRNPADLRKPLALPNGIHAETNLSANDLCSSLRTLLGFFSLPLTACTIFLRQDRDALRHFHPREASDPTAIHASTPVPVNFPNHTGKLSTVLSSQNKSGNA